MNVARWWKLDPEIVENWTMPDFLDRQEYMWIQIELDKPPSQIEAEKEIWRGPGSKI